MMQSPILSQLYFIPLAISLYSFQVFGKNKSGIYFYPAIPSMHL